MLVISIAMHLVAIGVFSVPFKTSSKKFQLPSSYSVNLVGDVGTGGFPDGASGRQITATKSAPTPPAKAQRPAPIKVKPTPTKKEQDIRSLSKKRTLAKATPTKQELSRLDQRLREIRKKTEPLDVTRAKGAGGAGSGGLPLSSSGGGRALDPAAERYILEVWEKIKNAWGVPGMTTFKKDLETVVTIKIRKDGRVVDIDVEKRSGNRIYDESILRVLRTVDPLPPIPDSLNTDSIEIGLRFLPGDLS